MSKTNRGGFLNDNGAPVQPAGDSSQAALDAQWWPILVGANDGTGVISGGMVTATTGMTVKVDGCFGSVVGVPTGIPDATLTLGPSDAEDRRFDLIIIRDGLLTLLAGVPHAIPCFPALRKDADTGKLSDVALAAVVVMPHATAITAEDIILLGVPPAPEVQRPIKAASFLPHRRRRKGTAADDEILWGYNGAIGSHMSVPRQDDCTTAPNGDIFTIYVNPLKSVIATYTPAGADGCAVFDLGGLPNDPFETGTDWTQDSHDFMVIGVSSDGYVHVVGNMHAQTLKYARCNIGTGSAASKMNRFEDIAYWSTANGGGYPINLVGPSAHRYFPMVGSAQEVQTGTDADSGRDGVTYPNFVTLSNGELVFIYRWGASGKGDTYMNRWNATTHAWVRIGLMVNEKTPVGVVNYNAYPQKIVPGRNRNIHFMFCERETGCESTNDGMYYVVFTGLGTGQTPGARDSAGVAKVLPIRPFDPAVPANQRPEEAGMFPRPGLMNSGGMCIDRDDWPHACVSYAADFAGACHNTDGGPYQNYHLWRDATGWHTEQITDGPVGAQRNMIFATPDGGVYIVGAVGANDRRDGVRVWDCTPGGGRSTFLLATFDEFGELTYDTRALDEHGLFRCLIGGGQGWYVDPGDNDLTPGDVPIGHWANAIAGLTLPRAVAGVLTVDIMRINDFKAGLVNLPGIRTIATDGYRDRAISKPVKEDQAGNPIAQPISDNVTAAGDGWYSVGAGRSGATPVPSGEDTTLRVMTAGPVITVGRQHPGRILFARQMAMLNPIASGEFAAVCVYAARNGIVGDPGNGADFRRVASLWNTSGFDQDAMMSTAWCGLHLFDDMHGVLGWLTAQVWPDGGTANQTHGAWIAAQMIELGELFCG